MPPFAGSGCGARLSRFCALSWDAPMPTLSAHAAAAIVMTIGNRLMRPPRGTAPVRSQRTIRYAGDEIESMTNVEDVSGIVCGESYNAHTMRRFTAYTVVLAVGLVAAAWTGN